MIIPPMGRTRIKPIKQPDEHSWAPASLRHAMSILGKRASVNALVDLCKTTRNGTSDRNLLHAIRTLGLSAVILERANLKHIQSALSGTRSTPRVALVDYLCENKDAKSANKESGHWAVVSSFSASRGKIQLLDSNTGKRVWYPWTEFRKRWMDYEYKKRKLTKRSRKYKLIKRWQKQLLVVVAGTAAHLPNFTVASARVYA